MFDFSVNNHMRTKKSNEKKIHVYLLAYFLTMIIQELKSSVEHGRVVTTLNIIFS